MDSAVRRGSLWQLCFPRSWSLVEHTSARRHIHIEHLLQSCSLRQHTTFSLPTRHKDLLGLSREIVSFIQLISNMSCSKGTTIMTPAGPQMLLSGEWQPSCMTLSLSQCHWMSSCPTPWAEKSTPPCATSAASSIFNSGLAFHIFLWKKTSPMGE